MIAKKFKNFTDTEFSWKFDGIEHTFSAGMEIFLEDFKADHFAKHLVDREMNRLHLQTSNVAAREKLTIQCFPMDIVVTPSEAFNLNEEAKVEEAKKEVEFEDLKQPEEVKEEVEKVKVEVVKPKLGRPKKYEKYG